MFKSNHIENFSILIIDKNKKFNSKLTTHLKQYGYDVIQLFCEQDVLKELEDNSKNIGLVILNLNVTSRKKNDLFHKIQQFSDVNIIILSDEDIGSLRESYFRQGVIDYHIVSPKVHHLSDDIHMTVQNLLSNKEETLLIIDNSESISNTLKRILETRGYKVLTANSAQDGLEILRNNVISVLILDMELPDIHGLQVLEGLRDLYLLNEFFVLAISSSNDPSMVRDILKGGAKNFLRKPFLFEEFLLKVDLLVQDSRARYVLYEQKREIENSLRSFKELLHSTINPMFIFKNHVCIDCNKEAAALLELNSIQSVQGKDIVDIFKDVSKEHLEELIENETDHYFEDIILSNSGNRYNVQVKERNIIIDRKLLKIISVMDITEIKRNEKIISQQSKMASMGEMIGNIAHQWRQPLTAISIAASGIKLNYELDMENREDTIDELDNIVKNTQFLSDTIEDFQNFLKNNRDVTQFFIGQIIEKTLSIIRANLESQGVRVILNIEDIQLEGIPNDLMQALLNVINNSVDALKNMDENKRLVSITAKVKKRCVQIDVQDSGKGVSDKIIDHIFEPYFTTKHQSQGTGLGLYMTHQIIEKMGGTIEVSNESFSIDKKKYFGAKFSFNVPLIFT